MWTPGFCAQRFILFSSLVMTGAWKSEYLRAPPNHRTVKPLLSACSRALRPAASFTGGTHIPPREESRLGGVTRDQQPGPLGSFCSADTQATGEQRFEELKQAAAPWPGPGRGRPRGWASRWDAEYTRWGSVPVCCPETCVRGLCRLPGTPQGSELGGMLWGVRRCRRHGESRPRQQIV